MKTTFAGHPLHPQIVMSPIGLFPFSFAMDLMYVATGNESFAETAYYTMLGGYSAGLAATAAAVPDYIAIPPKHEVQPTANMHVILNVTNMTLYTINLIARARNRKPGLFGLALSALGSAGIIVAQWYGGSLVYDHGMRVKDHDPLAKTKELKLPNDEKIAKTFKRASEFVPAGGVFGEPV